MQLSSSAVIACCGYVAFLVVAVVPTLFATAAGILVGHLSGRHTAAAWFAAVLAAGINVALAYSLYYYSTYLAGGRVDPSLYVNQCIGFGASGFFVGGSVSYLLCRAALRKR